jgi:hypothetical protein
MNAIAIWKADARRPAALFLAAAVFSAVALPQRALADDAVRKIDADFEKKFLQRIRDADDGKAKEQLRDAALRTPRRAESRQFEWDAVDRALRNEGVPKIAKPAAGMQQGIKIKLKQARTLMVIADGNLQIIVESVPVRDDPNEDEDLPDGHGGLQQQIRIARGSSEQLLFGSGNNESEARRQLFQRLWQKVAAVNRACGLTAVQSQKLELAGRGDIHRFFEQAAEMRSKFEAIQLVEGGDQRELLKRVFALVQESRPLRGTFDSGPFGEGSLFAKSLRRMLTPEQAARYAGAESSGAPPK